MGLFNNLMSKIFGHAAPAAPTVASAVGGMPAGGASGSASPAAAPAAMPAAAPAAPPPPPAIPKAPVDVVAILDGMAAKNPEKLDWKKSIVDLMKLVGMDSSFSARKQMASELHYAGDPNDSAAMNIWLHKEVLRQLAANGGKLPPELLD